MRRRRAHRHEREEIGRAPRLSGERQGLLDLAIVTHAAPELGLSAEHVAGHLEAQLLGDQVPGTGRHGVGQGHSATAEPVQHLVPRIDAVSIDQVADAARTLFAASNRTVGWFEPLPVTGS